MQDNILVGGCCRLFLLESPKSMSVLPFLKESSDYNMWTTPDTDLLINIYLWVFEVFNNEHDRNSLLLFRITLKLKSLKAVIKYMMKSNALVRPPSQYDTAPAHLKQTLTSQTVLQGHRDSVNALWFDVYLHDNEWRVWMNEAHEWMKCMNKVPEWMKNKIGHKWMNEGQDWMKDMNEWIAWMNGLWELTKGMNDGIVQMNEGRKWMSCSNYWRIQMNERWKWMNKMNEWVDEIRSMPWK